MHLALLILALAIPARAIVAVSAEAGADVAVPRISLQTSLTPRAGPALGTTLPPGLNASLVAPSALTAQALATQLPVSAVVAHEAAKAAASPAALHAEWPVIPATVARPVIAQAAVPGEEGLPSGTNIFDGSGAHGEADLPVSGFQEGATTVEPAGRASRIKRVLEQQATATAAGRLGLDGLSFKGGKWQKDGKILRRIGRGSIGFVDVHPTRPGLVVKTIDPHLDQLLDGLTIAEAIEQDERSAAALAASGVGPKVLGGAVIDGRRVTVRERIFGETMRELISDRAFGAEEEALVLDMVRRMAAKNLLVSDLKPENIMLDATERNGVRRAWFVDGGVVEAFEPGLDETARAQTLLDYPNVVARRQDFNSRRIIESVRTLRFFISEGREESAMSPWRLLRKRLLQHFLMTGLGAANK